MKTAFKGEKKKSLRKKRNWKQKKKGKILAVQQLNNEKKKHLLDEGSAPQTKNIHWLINTKWKKKSR